MVFIGMCLHDHVDGAVKDAEFLWQLPEHGMIRSAVHEHIDTRGTLYKNGVALADIEYRDTQSRWRYIEIEKPYVAIESNKNNKGQVLECWLERQALKWSRHTVHEHITQRRDILDI